MKLLNKVLSFLMKPILVGALVLAVASCGTVVPVNGDSEEDPGGGGGGNSDAFQVVFTPLGALLAFNLIDLEFLPGQNGELLVLAKDGTVYYLDNQFNLIATNNDFVGMVMDDGERGMLNLAADPNYANNNMVYFFYTSNVGNPNDGDDDVNQVVRRTVNVNKAGGTLALDDPQMVIDFPKSDLGGGAANNHNGGAMVFDPWGNLTIGVGDGGGDGTVSQDETNKLGKLHRLVPVATPGVGGYTLPTQPVDDLNDNPGGPDTVYSLGVRNVFTIANKDKGDQLFGDVGAGAFEELNCLYHANENFGWPVHEGPSAQFPFITPAHGYAHGDDSFANQDPLAAPGGGLSIMVTAFIEGPTAYGDDGMLFERRVIYSDFFQGWVRALRVETNHLKSDDRHIGHLTGMSSLQFNPADGFYYAVSLFGANQIHRMELAP